MAYPRSWPALLALLAPLAAWPAERAVQAFERRQEACAPVRDRAFGVIAAMGQTCAEDWACQRQAPWLLGCGAWTRLGWSLPASQRAALDEACGPFSLAEPCDRAVGACVRGRCQGRPPALQGCEAARAALQARLAAPAPCERDADCGPPAFPRELHALLDACWTGGAPPAMAPGRCVERRCRPAPPGARPPPPPGRRPSAAEVACVTAGLRSLAAGRELEAHRLTLRFLVTARGQAQGLSVLDADRPAPLLAVAQVLQGCRFDPGARGGQDGGTWVVMPVALR